MECKPAENVPKQTDNNSNNTTREHQKDTDSLSAECQCIVLWEPLVENVSLSLRDSGYHPSLNVYSSLWCTTGISLSFPSVSKQGLTRLKRHIFKAFYVCDSILIQVKGIVHTKKQKNSAIIYSSLCCTKLMTDFLL